MKLPPRFWSRAIVVCGVYSASLALIAAGLLGWRLVTDVSVRGPHAVPFFFLCGLLLLVSYRLVIRRAGAGVIIALLGWSVVSMMVAFSPWSAVNISIFVVSTLVPVIILTFALFYGEDAWKAGF